MFVIRCLIAVLATMVVALTLGVWVGYSVWQSVGMALLAGAFLQVLALCYVILCTVGGAPRPSRRNASPARVPQQDVQNLRDQLFILPK